MGGPSPEDAYELFDANNVEEVIEESREVVTPDA
jgi:hypothetical protein